jgi:1-acyl-sn-glycerol-3-phosphate acyltransferase
MKWLNVILVPIWRLWFYITVLISIAILFPFLFVSSLRERDYPVFFRFARVWAHMVLYGIGISPQVINGRQIQRGEQYVFCPNHSSMIDIMLMFVSVPACFKFIGKRELVRIPVFGYFYRRTNILVDRSSTASRKKSLEEGAKALDNGIGLCVFPEGGVPEEEWLLAPFKRGAFRLASEFQIPLVPVTFADNKRRFPYALFRGGPGKARAYIHDPIHTEGLGENELKEQVYEQLYESLISFGVKGRSIYEDQ